MPECQVLSLQILTARHLDALRVHPAVTIAEQRGHHLPDIVWLTHTAQSDGVRYRLIHRRVAAHGAAAEVGGNGAWRDAVDGDVAAAQLLGQVVGEDLDGPFERRVRDGVRRPEAGQARSGSPTPRVG